MFAFIACALSAWSATPAATPSLPTVPLAAPVSGHAVVSPITLITQYYCEIVGRRTRFTTCPEPLPTPTPIGQPQPTLAPPTAGAPVSGHS
jgi:hypothetical protein